MKTSTRGIATIALVIIVVVVIAVAGVGAYVLLSSSSPSSSTTTSPVSSTTSSPAQTTTTAPASTSTTTLPTSTYVSSTTTTSAPPTSTITTTSTTVATTPTTMTTATTASTVATYSCTTTFTTATSTVDYTPQYINLIKTYSAIEFKVSELNSTSGQQNNSTISYTTTSPSSGIYDVNFTITLSTGLESFGATVDANNNTVLSVSYSSFSFTGSQAKSFFDSFMAVFGLEETYGGEVSVLTDPAYFHSTGTSSMTFGTVSFDVTTWVANNLPESYSACGITSTISAYTLQVGTPPGTTLPFITYLHVVETAPSSESFTIQLVSMTVG